jgi:Protein of unknown function (DUF3172)
MPSRPSDRFDERFSERGSAQPNMLSAVNLAVLAAIFIVGIGIGILFSSTATFSTSNVASREAIDRSAPNAELCVQYGASAISMDLRAFVTLNPFNVYVSQPNMQPGCVLRSTNWSVLERNNQVSDEQVRECRKRLNTFAFTGDIARKDSTPQIDCVYQNDAAQNLFLNQPGFGSTPAESDRF